MEDQNSPKEIKKIWDTVKSKLIPGFMSKFKAMDLLGGEINIWLEEDWEDWEEWSADVTQIVTICGGKRYTTRSSLIKIHGKLFLTQDRINMEPSFEFDFDAKTGILSTDINIIKKIIRDKKKSENTFSMKIYAEAKKDIEDGMVLYDEKTERLKKKLQREIDPLFKQLGFNEEEKNMMTLGALAHRDFTTDLSTEGFMGLALRVRAEQMSHKG